MITTTSSKHSLINFISSFSPRENHKEMTKFQIGSGKSDSFFFFTSNNKFIIKTLKEDELKLLVRKGILDKYHQHIKKNPASLLSRFYGIFTVKINFMKPISVVIMDNLMGNEVHQIERIFDLKGSLHRRDTKKISNKKTVRKDLNFLRETDIVMKVSPSTRSDIKRRIQKDSEFLKQCGLMDYSLLLIVFSK
jgi:1-phosphatidylinositol-4-phosphate 5-kinase